MTQSERPTSTESSRFRHVLGNFPAGVAVVTTLDAQRVPVVLLAASFSPVSLEPPMIAISVPRGSAGLPAVRASDRFCVNLLSADQEPVYRATAATGVGDLADVPWQPSPRTGSPVIRGVAAWIDCEVDSIQETGDHVLVLGRPVAFDETAGADALLFFQGGYGRFDSPLQTAPAEPDILRQLRIVDLARPGMTELADDFDLEVVAFAQTSEDEIAVIATTGVARGGPVLARIGHRVPLIAPLGTLFVACQDDDAVTKWINRLGPDVPASDVADYRKMVERVRRRGYSLILSSEIQVEMERAMNRITLDAPTSEQLAAAREAALRLGTTTHEPERLDADESHAVRHLSAPIVDPDGSVPVMLNLYGLPELLTVEKIHTLRDRLLTLTTSVSKTLATSTG